MVLLGLAGNGVNARLPIDDVVNNDLAITASFGYTSAAYRALREPPAPAARSCSRSAPL